MTKAVTCPGCKQKFYPYSRNQKWCTPKCREKNKDKTKRKKPHVFGKGICETCGSEFEIKQSGGQRFCCRQCAAVGKAYAKSEERKTLASREKILITTMIPVFEHLRPRLGCIYNARRPINPNLGSVDFWIVEVNGKPVVVRQGECCVIGGVDE